jgi:hypothetical protein
MVVFDQQVVVSCERRVVAAGPAVQLTMFQPSMVSLMLLSSTASTWSMSAQVGGVRSQLKTMHTFFQPKQKLDAQSDHHAASLEAWSCAWGAAGWAVRVLTLRDAMKHPRFDEFEARINKLPLGERAEHTRMSYIRYVQGGPRL